jgi:hypothetical protein
MLPANDQSDALAHGPTITLEALVHSCYLAPARPEGTLAYGTLVTLPQMNTALPGGKFVSGHRDRVRYITAQLQSRRQM